MNALTTHPPENDRSLPLNVEVRVSWLRLRFIAPMAMSRPSRRTANKQRGAPPNRARTLWLFVTFGESQMIAPLIARKWLVSPVIHKDFRAYHLPLAHGNCASVTLNHQK
jgi:hypothetical protein